MKDETEKNLPLTPNCLRPRTTPERKSFLSAFILHPSSFILSVYVVLAVVGVHLIVFWAVADKHFLPKAPPYIPPPTPPNFGGGVQRTVDPHTGETVTETQFVVSTTFATPRLKASATAAANH